MMERASPAYGLEEELADSTACHAVDSQGSTGRGR